MTLTLTAQLPDAGTEAPESEKNVPLGAARTDPPGHVVDAPGVAVLVTPKGRLSVRETPVNAMPFGFAMVTVSSEVPPDRIVL